MPVAVATLRILSGYEWFGGITAKNHRDSQPGQHHKTGFLAPAAGLELSAERLTAMRCQSLGAGKAGNPWVTCVSWYRATKAGAP